MCEYLMIHGRVHEARMNPSHKSSANRRFERGDAIKILDGITFDFYTGLPHMYENRVVHNFFHVGGTMSLAELENMGALQLFILGGVWGHGPENFGDFRCSEEHSVHSDAYRVAQRAS